MRFKPQKGTMTIDDRILLLEKELENHEKSIPDDVRWLIVELKLARGALTTVAEGWAGVRRGEISFEDFDGKLSFAIETVLANPS